MDTLGSADPAAAAPGDDNQPPPTAWPLAVLPLSVALFSMDPSALRPCAFQIMTMLFHGDATQARDPTGFGMVRVHSNELVFVVDVFIFFRPAP
jgi:hypothetical protein